MGFHIFNISDPLNPVMVDTIDSTLQDFVKYGDFIFGSDLTEGVDILNIRDPTTIAQLNPIQPTGLVARCVAAYENYLFVGYQGLPSVVKIYDITNPYDVRQVGSQLLNSENPAFLGEITEIVVTQGDFYVADGRNGIMHGTWSGVGGSPDSPQTTTVVSNTTIYQNTTVSSGTTIYQNTTVTEVTTVDQTTTVVQSADGRNIPTSNDSLNFNILWFLLPISMIVVKRTRNRFRKKH
jgi:hypothetical protein